MTRSITRHGSPISDHPVVARPSSVFSVWAGCAAAVAVMALLLVQGCAPSSHYRASARQRAPGLTEDRGRHARGGTNPNAPFTLMTRVQPPTEDRVSLAQAAASAHANPCSPENLAVEEVAEQVNGDERFVSLAFVNSAEAPCTIGGYPSLMLLDERGVAVGSVSVLQVADPSQLAKTSDPLPISQPTPRSPLINMVLARGAEAYFGVSWVSGTACPSVSHIVVAAPGLTRTFSINHPMTVCSGQVRVTALRRTQSAS